jgi:hypothetical protein
MKDFTAAAAAGAIAGFMAMVVVGTLIVVNIANTVWERACIRHNVAHYDSKTGYWRWNNELAEDKEK